MKKISWFVLGFVVFCAPAMALSPGDICGIGPQKGNANRICDEKKLSVGTSCSTTGAVEGYCTNNVDRDGSQVISCSAKICDDDHILWLQKRKGKYVPYGRCQSKKAMQAICDKGVCPPTCECKLIELDWTWTYGPAKGKTTTAYHSDEMCRCIATKTDYAKSCQYKFTAKCNDGTEITDTDLRLPKIINLTQDDLSDPIVKNYYDLSDEDIKLCADGLVMSKENNNNNISEAGQRLFKKMYEKDNDEWIKWANDNKDYVEWYCNGGMEDTENANIVTTGGSSSYEGSVAGASYVNTGNTAAINNAKAVLSAFFAKAESDVSVWKNAEGKFNTARLASDLTAGVVLGTVGGLVSSVVIKKAQVKKGFEALQCYIHGYKVADWGDVFEASLRTK